MKTLLKLFVLMTIAWSLAACVSRPAGISKSEWESMSPAQKAAYRTSEHSEVNRARHFHEEHRRTTEQSIRAIESRVSDVPANP